MATSQGKDFSLIRSKRARGKYLDSTESAELMILGSWVNVIGIYDGRFWFLGVTIDVEKKGEKWTAIWITILCSNVSASFLMTL